MKKILLIVAIITLAAFNLHAIAPGDVHVEGKLGVGDSTPDQSLKADIEGDVGAAQYCDQNGDNCIAPPLQKKINGTCGSQERMIGVNSNGTPNCALIPINHIQGGHYGYCYQYVDGNTNRMACESNSLIPPATCNYSGGAYYCACPSGYTYKANACIKL